MNINVAHSTQSLVKSLNLPANLGKVLNTVGQTATGISGLLQGVADTASDFAKSALSSRTPRPSFARAWVPRRSPFSPHMHRCSHTYAPSQQVGTRSRVGQQYGFNFGPFHATGRITGAEYRGSFAKPVPLADGDVLFRGRKYDNLGAIFRDASDGRIDGFAPRGGRRPGASHAHPVPFAMNGLANGIQSLIGRIFSVIGGGQAGATNGTGSTGSTGNTGNTGSTGNSGGIDGSVLNDPNMSLEDKLALLMSKLSSHFDKQIEDKMKAIETQMSGEKGGKSAGSAKKGGLFSGLGKIFSRVGSIAGGAVAGPLGGIFGGAAGKTVGGLLGGLFGGGSTNGASSTGGSSKGQGSNLQLLQTQLQQLLQKRQQMFQTMSNITKSLHDTSMNTIRQLKA